MNAMLGCARTVVKFVIIFLCLFINLIHLAVLFGVSLFEPAKLCYNPRFSCEEYFQFTKETLLAITDWPNQDNASQTVD